MKKNNSALCAAFFLCVLMLFSVFKTETSTAVALGESKKIVYLTFDDGPSTRVTPKILDVLDEEKVKATFFIVGKNAVKRKDILRRAHKAGHVLAVHSYSHIYREIYKSPASLIADIDACNKIISEITGTPATLYRFPGGSFNLSAELKAAVKTRGLNYVDWNASIMDADLYCADADDLYRAASATSIGKNRVILLAHDGTDKLSTVTALPKIIAYFKENGYDFKTL